MKRAAAVVTTAAIIGAVATSACSRNDTTAPTAATTSPAASASAVSASAARTYARTPARTAFGDPIDLDVCAVAAAANLTGIVGTRLVAPSRAALGACSLTAVPIGTNSGDRRGRIDILVRSLPPAAGGVYSTSPVVTNVLGLPLARHPYNAAQASCPRVLTVPRAGVTTAYVRITNFGGAGRAGAATMCTTNERIAQRFVALARGVTPPTLTTTTTTTPSLLSVDACRVAGAARVGSYVDATAAGAALAYGSGCGFAGSAGRLDLSTVALRTASARVAGTARVVGGRTVYLQPDEAPQCAVSAPLGRQAVTVLFTSSTDSIPADCGPAGRALVAYLGVLTRR